MPRNLRYPLPKGRDWTGGAFVGSTLDLRRRGRDWAVELRLRTRTLAAVYIPVEGRFCSWFRVFSVSVARRWVGQGSV